MPDIKVLSPGRAAGLIHRFPDKKECWSKKLIPFRVWDYVRLKADPRHVGEVTGHDGRGQVTVRWPNGWISEHRETELEKDTVYGCDRRST